MKRRISSIVSGPTTVNSDDDDSGDDNDDINDKKLRSSPLFQRARSRIASLMGGVRKRHQDFHRRSIPAGNNDMGLEESPKVNDTWNYALLIVLYTLQGIPIGLSASIPFLLQDKIRKMASMAASGTMDASALSYKANAMFALCSWPFSLKLLWAPIVDALYMTRFGRRKSWLVPVQTLAGLLLVGGADFVEQQLGLGALPSGDAARSLLTSAAETVSSPMAVNIEAVTAYFFALYFLMATQDVAVDGWALTMLSKANRGKGPVCNSIGQNIGYFLAFVGFLALNDPDSSEAIWRPLLRLPSKPGVGLVSLGGFVKIMGYAMLVVTTAVAFFKKERPVTSAIDVDVLVSDSDESDDEAELDASEIGLKETYHRLWAVCQLPAVRWLFLILVTYRLPTALSDNVKFLKAVELGMSKSTTAMLSPTLILPLGILVPLIAARIWHAAPLRQFALGYIARITAVPILDIFMLHMVKTCHPDGSMTKFASSAQKLWYWLAVASSTSLQAICSSLQMNAQMTFFASRVDPMIGGSYMTLLNTAANLGGTWPASAIMWIVGQLPSTQSSYIWLSSISAGLGLLWFFLFRGKLAHLSTLPDDAWRTHMNENEEYVDEEGNGGLFRRKKN